MLPGNADTWLLWRACRTQWRMAFGGPVGLDYGPVYQVAGTFGIEITPCLLQKLQLLEADVLATANKEHAPDADR